MQHTVDQAHSAVPRTLACMRPRLASRPEVARCGEDEEVIRGEPLQVRLGGHAGLWRAWAGRR